MSHAFAHSCVHVDEGGIQCEFMSAADRGARSNVFLYCKNALHSFCSPQASTNRRPFSGAS